MESVRLKYCHWSPRVEEYKQHMDSSGTFSSIFAEKMTCPPAKKQLSTKEENSIIADKANLSASIGFLWHFTLPFPNFQFYTYLPPPAKKCPSGIAVMLTYHNIVYC